MFHCCDFSFHWEKVERVWDSSENGRNISSFVLVVTQSPPVCRPEPYDMSLGVGGWLFHTELRGGFPAQLAKVCYNSAGFIPMNLLNLVRKPVFFNTDFMQISPLCLPVAQLWQISVHKCWLAQGLGVKVAHNSSALFSLWLMYIATTLKTLGQTVTCNDGPGLKPAVNLLFLLPAWILTLWLCSKWSWSFRSIFESGMFWKP